MRESALERMLKTKVEKADGECWKFVSPGLRGVPDRICIFPGGRIAFVEMKKEGGELSALQKKRLKRLAILGVSCYVLNSVDLVETFVELYREV